MNLPEFPAILLASPKAEHEPWLSEVFVRSNAFEQYASAQSFIIYGVPRSGKTALRLFLQQTAPENVLAVPWSPEPIVNPDAGTGTVFAQETMRQALKVLVEYMISHGQMAKRLKDAPRWAGTALAWYLQEYLPVDASFYIESRSTELSPAEITWYLELLDKPPAKIFKETASQNDQLRMLMSILQQAQYQYVWWMIDGLEKWPPQSEKQITLMIDALLSTLAIFEVPQYIFKLFVPASYKEFIKAASGVERHRVSESQLDWTQDALSGLLEKRLAVGFSQPDFKLSQLSEDPDFYAWLKQYGGQNPRTWLALAHPFVDAFQVGQRPLKPESWQAIAQAHPPLLRLIVERQEVQIGESIVSIDSKNEFNILRYLYFHPEKICSLEEIYFCALNGLEQPPRKMDKEWVHKSVWRPALDTALYRLRKKIEQQPGNPVYLRTHPHKGLELNHTVV